MSRPFDEARYRGLLEGLEVVEVTYRNALAKERIDAEGFGKTEARFLAMLSGRHCDELIALAEVSDGNHLSIAEDFSMTSGVRYLRGQDISSDMMLDDKNAVFIPESEYAKLARSHIFRGDVLLTIVGANTGQAALVDEAPDKLTANCKLGIIRARKESGVPPEYLHVFLASRFGQFQIQQSKRGAGQTGLILPDLKTLSIPRFRLQFEQKIAALSLQAHKSKRESKAIFLTAEQTLLRALGLENWQPPEPLAYTRPSRDAFAAGRLDSEHFKPKYAGLETHIRATGSFAKLEDLLVINERGTQPDYAESGLAVVNSKHVANGEVRLNDDNRVAIAGSNALKIKPGDVLMNGTGVGTIGRAAPFLHDAEALPDNHVTVLRPKVGRIDPVYLSVYLNSLAGQYQVNKWLRGSSGQIELYPNDIAQFLVWIAPTEVQQAIRKAIDDAFAAKRNATQLLDAARRAVEIAIEQSEATALAWLDKTVAALNQPIASAPAPCDHSPTPEPDHDPQTTPATGTTPEAVAHVPPGRGQSARGLSGAGDGVHPELHGPGGGAGGPGSGAGATDSTRPLDATRDLATAAGSLTYTEVSERLAVNIVYCLDDLLDANPEDIAFTPDWIRDLHRRLAGELFPEWGGRFRTTDVQVGTHLPPPAHAVAVEINNFCLDLQERLRHLTGAESIADLLAWVDWRFQWIHPFKDFNGRVGRVVLVALTYKLGLPPIDPGSLEDKGVYFAALRAADAGDLSRLRELWLERLGI